MGILSQNMFAYCKNNPVNNRDSSGNAAETVLDVISFGMSIADVIARPDDPWAWAALAGDAIDIAIPFVAGVGEAIKTVNAARKTADVVDDTYDAIKAVKSIHGNSLDYLGINYGYVLSDKTTGEVVKFGESINPAHRYTKKFLNGEMTVVISGTKQEVHNWQHNQIVDFYEAVGRLPALNKSTW